MTESDVYRKQLSVKCREFCAALTPPIRCVSGESLSARLQRDI